MPKQMSNEVRISFITLNETSNLSLESHFTSEQQGLSPPSWSRRFVLQIKYRLQPPPKPLITTLNNQTTLDCIY